MSIFFRYNIIRQFNTYVTIINNGGHTSDNP